MTKQEIIDKYWLEFIEWYRHRFGAAKGKKFKIEAKYTNPKTINVSKNQERVDVSIFYVEFKDPTETTFWKWWALVRKSDG